MLGIDYAPRGQSVHTREHVAGTCTHNILMCVQMLWFCPCCMSPLHVPATCPLIVHYTPFCQRNMSLQHAPAIWPIVSGHLYYSLFQPIGALFIHKFSHCFPTHWNVCFPPTEMLTKSGQWAHLTSSVLIVSWKSFHGNHIRSHQLCRVVFWEVFKSENCCLSIGLLAFTCFCMHEISVLVESFSVL